MTSLVFPVLPGLTFGNRRVPMWRTGAFEALSGKESRIAYRRYPLIRFEMNFEFLRDNLTVSELKTLVGLFNACQGQYDSFLFTDPEFNSVTLENFGTGDGATLTHQLIARYQNTGGPGYAERIQNLNGAPSIFKNGVLQTTPTNYSLGPTGIITWVTAPAAGQALTWTGNFYYRCRFLDDEIVPVRFMNKWWEMPVAFRSIAL